MPKICVDTHFTGRLASMTKAAGGLCATRIVVVDLGNCAHNMSEYRWQYHCADMGSISTTISDFREYRGDNS